MEPVLPPSGWPGRGFSRLGLLAAAGLALGACAVEKKLPFDAAAHAGAQVKGTARIDGEGFLRRNNGALARCSGEMVYLLPDTAYFREWIDIYRAGHLLEDAGARSAEHGAAVRRTQCTMRGGFIFEDLPAGKWLVLTRITYDAEANFAFLSRQDHTFLAEVETRAGVTTPVILSNPNRI